MGSVFLGLEDWQRELIVRHLELVLEANEVINLTRIVDFDEAMVLHVEDSLSGLEDLEKAPEGLYGDLGSGGGFPGIPLAVASGRQAVLIDSRKRKMEVMDSIIAELGLSQQITTYAGRAELLARTRSKRFAALTARALAKLSVITELASPLLKKGGRLICYKANMEESELAYARRVQKATGMKFLYERELQLGENFFRKIVVFEKVAEPTVKLPRLEGQAQKNPL